MSNKIVMKDDETLSLKEGWKKFERHCKVKNLAEVTIDYYKVGFEYLVEYFNENYKIKDIDHDKIEGFIENMKINSDIKDTTINTRLRAIRRFLYYYMEKGYLKKYKINLLKVQKNQKKPYTDQELKKLLVKPDMDNCRFSEYRNWVIINFLLGTGVRLSSLINLKIGDISLENAVVDLRQTKNRQQRIIPLSKSLVDVLMEYLTVREGEDKDYLFCTEYGLKLKSDSIRSAIYRYNKRHDVDKTSIHLFRHTFAKKYILNGGDPFRLQKILGHASMRIVRQYVNIYNEDLKENFNQYNPLEEFKTNGEYIDIGK